MAMGKDKEDKYLTNIREVSEKYYRVMWQGEISDKYVFLSRNLHET